MEGDIAIGDKFPNPNNENSANPYRIGHPMYHLFKLRNFPIWKLNAPLVLTIKQGWRTPDHRINWALHILASPYEYDAAISRSAFSTTAAFR